MKTLQELIEKAKKEWGETWDEGMIEYDAECNEYIVWVGKPTSYSLLRCRHPQMHWHEVLKTNQPLH